MYKWAQPIFPPSVTPPPAHSKGAVLEPPSALPPLHWSSPPHLASGGLPPAPDQRLSKQSAKRLCRAPPVPGPGPQCLVAWLWGRAWASAPPPAGHSVNDELSTNRETPAPTDLQPASGWVLQKEGGEIVKARFRTHVKTLIPLKAGFQSWGDHLPPNDWAGLPLWLPFLLFGSQVNRCAEDNRRGPPLPPALAPVFLSLPTRLRSPPGKGRHLPLPLAAPSTVPATQQVLSYCGRTMTDVAQHQQVTPRD